MKRSEAMDRLFQSFLKLENIDECYAYFEDLCTIKELTRMAERLEGAMRPTKCRTWRTPNEQEDVSTATIGRVSKCLNYGAGGYKTTLKKLEEE